MEQRQRGEKYIIGAKLERLGHAIRVLISMGVINHHPFRAPGGARGIENGSKVARSGALGKPLVVVACEGGKIDELEPALELRLLGEGGITNDPTQVSELVLHRFQGRKELEVDNHQARTGVVDDMCEQLTLISSVDRDLDSNELGGCEPQRDEVHVVLEHQQYAVTRFDPCRGQCVSQPIRLPIE